ncbi:hypothetical protein AYO20_01780 [Fonsecaea nubica]|uniref:Uncharacterized protein n=1 Tax=Fonsecaea nubica TaxID=856822 RepID=A0A178DA49_9EURO|nr:hypothetical protein AYO20_01780 [Fonsecaea nubica]OAL39029.1 hypothetical protein AYO20_01780 [Fonsecaea nubica]
MWEMEMMIGISMGQRATRETEEANATPGIDGSATGNVEERKDHSRLDGKLRDGSLRDWVFEEMDRIWGDLEPPMSVMVVIHLDMNNVIRWASPKRQNRRVITEFSGFGGGLRTAKYERTVCDVGNKKEEEIVVEVRETSN